jgi:hypothetical protein
MNKEATEEIRLELTGDQVDLIEQIGWVMQYPLDTRLIYLPHFFEKVEDRTYIGHRPHAASDEWTTDKTEFIKEAMSDVHQREFAPFIKELTDRLERYKAAMEKVIEMNYQEAEDRYGDRSKASSWGCVVVLESGLTEPK